uniref:Uncharacterized protein n=1 Tax=Solanum tuberosum TaxID=4113 RepID=M1CJP7_SOLTU
MSLKSDWPKRILFQSQLPYSKTINRGLQNSEKRTKNFNKKLEKARGSKPADFSTSSRVQEFKHSSFKNVQVSRTIKIKNNKDQDRQIQDQAQSPWIQLEVKIKIKFKFKFKFKIKIKFKSKSKFKIKIKIKIEKNLKSKFSNEVDGILGVTFGSFGDVTRSKTATLGQQTLQVSIASIPVFGSTTLKISSSSANALEGGSSVAEKIKRTLALLEQSCSKNSTTRESYDSTNESPPRASRNVNPLKINLRDNPCYSLHLQ